MDDQDWETQGLDPGLRASAAEAAARRGMSLSAYVAEALGLAPAAAAPRHAPSAVEDDPVAEHIHRSLRDIRLSVAGLEKAQQTAHANLARDLAQVSHAVTALGKDHDALKHALANDFLDLADQSLSQIDARLGAAAAENADRDERLVRLEQRAAAQEAAIARAGAAWFEKLDALEAALDRRLSDTARAQQKSDAALTSEIAQAAYELRGAVDALRADMGKLDAARLSDLDRLERIDRALDKALGELAVVQSVSEQGFQRATENQAQIQRHLTRVNADWDARFDALSVRLGKVEQDAGQGQAVTDAELERIEACTVAALQKLGGDIAAVCSAGAALDGETRARLDAMRQSQELIGERLAMLESAAGRAETEQALAIIRDRIAALSEAQAGAEIRLAQIGSAAEPDTLAPHIRALEEQVRRMEQRHANALDMLRGQLAQFAAENEQRLAFIESTPASVAEVDVLAFRLARIEQRDVEGDLQTLRARLEERLHDIEAHSVRALERLGASIAALERRMLEDDRQAEARSA